jgi:hypothetical protein
MFNNAQGLLLKKLNNITDYSLEYPFLYLWIDSSIVD